MGCEVRVLHEPGQCDSDYRADCDGIGRLQEDPFLAEIDDDHTLYWLCSGLVRTHAMEI